MDWWFIIGVTAAGILCLIKVIVDRQGEKLPGTLTDFVNENGVDFPIVQFQYNGQDMKLLAANGGNKKLNQNDPVEIIYRPGKAAGIAKGEVIGRSEERADIILNMHKKGYSLEQIMDVTNMSEDEIKAIIG